MSNLGNILHRGRRLAAKSTRLARGALSSLRKPSEVELMMRSLPVVESAGPGLNGKIVVITGSTQGIGLVVARAFARRGAQIVINSRRQEAVDKALDKLGGDGAVAGFAADVSTAKGVKRLLDGAVERFGTIDILVNNAAIAGPMQPIWTADDNELSEAFQINLTGPILCARAAIAWFLDHGKQGRVINLSSIVTEGDYPNFSLYASAKAGLEAFTRHAASDLPAAETVVTGLILPSVQTERKFAADWASTELLPPPESLLPAFEYVSTGPANLLHGRNISAARFIREPRAEAALAGVASTREQILYPKIELDGSVVARDPQARVLLDRAENQHGPSPKAIEAIRESLGAHNPAYYPDERFSDLCAALAEEHGLTPDHFALGPGSWEIIARTIQLFAKPGEEIVSSGPGWFGFNLTCMRNGIQPKLVPFDRGEQGNSPSFNLQKMRDAITPRTRLVYLISPSNPEGVTLKHGEVLEFLSDLPPELPVMIDEAYVEYADDPDLVRTAELVRESDNFVIGLRTFSKFHALAGLRVGYAYARPENVGLIRRSEQIFTLAHVAERAAIAALRDEEHRAKVWDAARRQRHEMQQGLARLGLDYIPSQAPYIFTQAPKNFDTSLDILLREGILVPRFRFSDGKMVMIPVGTADQNKRILDALESGM